VTGEYVEGIWRIMQAAKPDDFVRHRRCARLRLSDCASTTLSRINSVMKPEQNHPTTVGWAAQGRDLRSIHLLHSPVRNVRIMCSLGARAVETCQSPI
jgi:GDP-D-mannose dehydratase